MVMEKGRLLSAPKPASPARKAPARKPAGQ